MTTDLIKIRRSQITDAAAIAEVYAECWRVTYQGIIPHSQLEAMIRRRTVNGWKKVIAKSPSSCDHARGAMWRRRGSSTMLTLTFDRTPVGYANIGSSRHFRLPYEGEIFELYIAPVYQGLGFGRRLFRASKKKLRSSGLRGLVVWALEDNELACRFYLSRGGTQVEQSTEKFGGKTLNKIAFGWRR